MTCRGVVGKIAFCIVSVAILTAALGWPAHAQGLDERFFGKWSGSGRIVTYENGKEESADRDIEIEISKAETGGFEVHNVEMATIEADRITIRSEGAAGLHQVFEPIKGGARWQAQKACADIAQPQGCAWAQLNGNVLAIDTLVIDDKGRQNVLSARRELTANGMIISFERIAAGKIIRRVEATLHKTGE